MRGSGCNMAGRRRILRPFSQSATLLFELTKYTSLAGPTALKGIQQSSITPTFTYNSVDSQLFPTHGRSFYFGSSFVGGPLGGNINTISNNFEMTYFRPAHRGRNVIAVKFASGIISGYGGKEIPPNSRFYLGGEQDVRGYDFYTISPFVFIPDATTTVIPYTDPHILNAQGNPTTVLLPVNVLQFVPTRPGGDTRGVLNTEYRIPLMKTYVSMSLFHDLGLSGDIAGLHLDPAAVNALQQQYPNPDFPGLQIPSKLRISSGTNFRPHTSAGVEVTFQLPIIQAPFRIYYAYNYLRLTQTIRPPIGAWELSPAVRQSLIDSGVYFSDVVPALTTFLQQAQSTQTIPPGLLEPKSTLRFTVGRTF